MVRYIAHGYATIPIEVVIEEAESMDDATEQAAAMGLRLKNDGDKKLYIKGKGVEISPAQIDFEEAEASQQCGRCKKEMLEGSFKCPYCHSPTV